MAASTKTMQQIVTRAYQKRGTLRMGETPKAAEVVQALDALNGMMHNWRNYGVDVEHVTLDLADTFPLDEKYNEGVAAMLAALTAADMGDELSQQVASSANECWKSLLAEYLDIAEQAEFDPVLTNMPSQRLLLGQTA